LHDALPISFHDAPVLEAAGVGFQGAVDDVRLLDEVMAVGIERMLETGADHDVGLVLENVHGAVTLVHIEVHNGDPLDAMVLHGMSDTYCHIIEKGKAHGLTAFGMMSGRARGAEGSLMLAR